MKPCPFVGVNTHKNSHSATVLNGYFDVLATIGFANNQEGFCHLDLKLKKLAGGRRLTFGLED